MGFNFFPHHSCFSNQLKKLSKKFKDLDAHLSEVFKSIEENPKQGVWYPGLGVDGIRKIRISLRSQNIGKSGGLRFIFLVFEEKQKLIKVAIYSERNHSGESNIRKMIKENLKTILYELDQTDFLQD